MTPVRTASSRVGAIDQQSTERLFARWRHERDRRAREELICRFMPVARRLASRYRSPNEAFEDLVQVAVVGLIGAVDRFDPDRGATFIGFAIPTILGELKRHFRNTGWSVHVPRGAQELSLRVARAERELTARFGRYPSLLQIAQYLEIDLESVLCGLDAGVAHHATSLEAPVGKGHDEDEPELLGATIGSPDERLDVVEMCAALDAAIRRLPYMERAVLELKLSGEPLRQVDIAERLGCSQMQVSRLLARAQRRLRDAGALT